MRLNALAILVVLVLGLGIGLALYVAEVQARFETRVCKVVLAVTAPVPAAPAGTDQAAIARIKARNEQLAGERTALLDVLGKQKGC